MNQMPYRFSRPDDLELVDRPKLSVAVVIACRDGQEKLDLVLASLVAQSYPASLTSVYVSTMEVQSHLLCRRLSRLKRS